MRWHVVEKLSQRQGFNAAGFLVVTDTIIARCGDQIYHHMEVPLDPDDDGLVRVARDSSEVFRPEAIASFEGVPITDDHPDVEVSPDNWRDLACGHIQNVRRGKGADSDCLVADLIISDPGMIQKVRGRHKLALSCGYDAYYEQVAKGRGAQKRIVGNHVALVDEGRCGARCSIGDSGAAIYSYQAVFDAEAACACDACEERAWIDAGGFNEADHPREPGGSAKGGQFTSGGGSGGGGGMHHDMLKGAGFKQDAADPDTFHGDHIDKPTMTQMDSFLKTKGFQHVSHSNAWTHPDFTHLEVTENDPAKGSTVKLSKIDSSQWSGGGGASGAGPGTTGKSTSFSKSSESPEGINLHGVPFAHWANAPKTNQAWESLAKLGAKKGGFEEPPLPKSKGKQGAGVIIQEPDGRVWIVHPTKQYGGYKATFPKGTVEDDMSLHGTALKEAYEESGLHVQLTGFAGDVERTTGSARYYYAKRMGGTPNDHGWESEAVTLAHPDDLKGFLNHPIDQGIVDKHITKTAPAETQPAKTQPSSQPLKLAEMKKVGQQLGSNPGGQYEDASGNKHYVKLSKSNDHAKNELLASRLYEAAGAPILNAQPVDMGNGKMGTATPWQKVDLIDKNNAEHRKQAQEHFATHAWLANWDAAGLSYDNQGMVNGKMTTLDPGGSLLYRAQGGPKGNAFGDQATEWDSLRLPSNKQAHTLYGEMSGKQLRNSALNVAKVPDAKVRELTMQHGPGDEAGRTALAERLIARKRDIIKRAMGTADARWPGWADDIDWPVAA